MPIPILPSPSRLHVWAVDPGAHSRLARWAPALLSGLGWSPEYGAIPTVDARLPDHADGIAADGAVLLVQESVDPPHDAGDLAAYADRGGLLLADRQADASWWPGTRESVVFTDDLPPGVWRLLVRWASSLYEPQGPTPWLALAHGGRRTPGLAMLADELRRACGSSGLFVWREGPAQDAGGVLLLASSPGLSASADLVHARRAGTPLVLVQDAEGPLGLHVAVPDGCLKVAWSVDGALVGASRAWLQACLLQAQLRRAREACGVLPAIHVVPRPVEVEDLAAHGPHLGRSTFVLHPDPPLPPTRLGLLKAVAPHWSFRTPLTLLSGGGGAPPVLDGLNVALSASMNEPELQVAGLGDWHIVSLVSAVCAGLLARGARVAYAGARALSQHTDRVDITSQLAGTVLDACLTYAGGERPLQVHEAQAGGGSLPGIEFVVLESRRLQARAAARGLTGLVDLAARVWDDTLGEQVQLSLTRALQCSDVQARVVIGGKLHTRPKGLLPGIAEETWRSIVEWKQPTYVLGGFGGAARVMADLLLGVTVAPPAWMVEPEMLARRERLSEPASHAMPTWDALCADLQRSGQALGWWGDQTEDEPGLRFNGLTRAENLRLLRTTDVLEAIALIQHGLQRWRNGVSPSSKLIYGGSRGEGTRLVGVDVPPLSSGESITHPLGFTWNPVELGRAGVVMLSPDLLIFDRAGLREELWRALARQLDWMTVDTLVVDDGDLTLLLGPEGLHRRLPPPLSRLSRLMVTGPWQAWATGRDQAWKRVAVLSRWEAVRAPAEPLPVEDLDLVEHVALRRVPQGIALSCRPGGGVASAESIVAYDSEQMKKVLAGNDEAQIMAFSRTLSMHETLVSSTGALLVEHGREEARFPSEPLWGGDLPIALKRPVVRALRVDRTTPLPAVTGDGLRVLLCVLDQDPRAGGELVKQVEQVYEMFEASTHTHELRIATSWRAGDLQKGDGWHIIHIATHGRHGRRLQTADGWVGAEQLRPSRRPSLIFLSACDAGDTDDEPGESLTSWFGALGGGALVAPQVRIAPDVATRAALAVYAGLIAGSTLAQAVLSMRQVLWEQKHCSSVANILQFGGEHLTLSRMRQGW